MHDTANEATSYLLYINWGNSVNHDLTKTLRHCAQIRAQYDVISMHKLRSVGIVSVRTKAKEFSFFSLESNKNA
jgi:hypothetical protein